MGDAVSGFGRALTLTGHVTLPQLTPQPRHLSPRFVPDINQTRWRATEHCRLSWGTMSKPSLLPCLLQIKPRLTLQRTPQFASRAAIRGYHLFRRAGIETRPTLAAQVLRTSAIIPYESSRISRRNMSTPADHQPLKKPPKTPAVPRPSSRYVSHPLTCLTTIVIPPPQSRVYIV